MERKTWYLQFFIMQLFILGCTMPSYALPKLQIYIPGATYDIASETWIINSYDYELWVVGAKEEIFDVKIALATPLNEEGTITLSWLDPESSSYTNVNGNSVEEITLSEDGAMGYEEYRASYETGAPDPNTYGFAQNQTPLMGDGSQLPPHGVFPTDFFEYYIGNFGTNELVYDFSPPEGYDGDTYSIDDFSELSQDWGDIKKFHLNVDGYTWVDIVAYDHYVQSNSKAHYVFTPFSHDGGGGAQIPEPATFMLFGCGCLVLGRTLKGRG